MFSAVQCLYGYHGFFFIGHYHKGKAFILSGNIIYDDGGRRYGAERAEEFREVFFFPFKGDAAHIDIHIRILDKATQKRTHAETIKKADLMSAFSYSKSGY